MNTVNYEVEVTSPHFGGSVIALVPDYVIVAQQEWRSKNFKVRRIW
jgi:hypothetical protein